MKNMKEKSLFEKIIIGVYILSAITCVVAVIYMLADKHTHQILGYGIFLALSIEILVIMFLNVARLIHQIFIGSQNLKKCNIPVFEQIDNFGKRFRYSDDKKVNFMTNRLKLLNCTIKREEK